MVPDVYWHWPQMVWAALVAFATFSYFYQFVKTNDKGTLVWNIAVMVACQVVLYYGGFWTLVRP